MKKNGAMIIVVIISLFSSFFTLTSVAGISFTYTQYWFYIDRPQLVEYTDMSFTVKNNHASSREIVCTYQQIAGIDVEVIFDWNRMNISAGEAVVNNYKLNVTGEFSAIFNLEIFLREKPTGASDSQLATGGIINNKVAFYSDQEGSLLTLRITDQADHLRDARVKITYSVNNSMPFTPIKEFNGSSFYGVLPYGNYRVHAYDLKAQNVYAEKSFILNESTKTLNVPLALVGFGMFRLVFIDAVGINSTIFNHVGEIAAVQVYGELMIESTREVVETTVPWEFSPLQETKGQLFTFWFNYQGWIYDTNYIVKGIIKTGEQLVAFKFSEKFSIPPPENKPLNIPLEFIILGLSAITIISVYAYIEYQKRKMRVLPIEKK